MKGFGKLDKDGQIILDRNKIVDAHFAIPLAFSSNSQKLEQYLNSVVEKKMLKHKIPGISSVVVSQEGFTSKRDIQEWSTKKINNSGTIFTRDYDPSQGLKATYVEDIAGNLVLHEAQVLATSNFHIDKQEKSSNGKFKTVKKPINLKDYTDENGLLRTFSQKEYNNLKN